MLTTRPRVSVATTAAAEGLRGFVRAKDQSFIYIERRVHPPRSVPSTLPALSIPRAFSLTWALSVCDGPNTSPVDTRQQYITRPTVQTNRPRPSSRHHHHHHLSSSLLSPPPVRSFSHLHVASVPRRTWPLPPPRRSQFDSRQGPTRRCQIYDFRTFTVKISHHTHTTIATT